MFRDARLYQILFLSSFLLLGTGTRDWTLHPEIVATAIATCLITQWVWSIRYVSPLHPSTSPLFSAFRPDHRIGTEYVAANRAYRHHDASGCDRHF